MTRIGITGHTGLTAATTRLVQDALAGRLHVCGSGLVGMSCLAPGADQVFADTVLTLGGRLEVILPANRYRDNAIAAAQRPAFDTLLHRAATVRVMPYAEPSPAAYRAANAALLADVDRLFAVWDGSDGEPGGTSDAVAAALRRGVPVDIVWPEGARRE
ncbi:hypothetical protein [Nocardia sp. BMG51109]|uniref:hypothetical protein n=1 Tax=Nocardia sp. BMG51109 TaxID=1056816 RepID=UPI0004653FF4|nr:hypothetical protein [Nocardia sp. BMG51109]